MPLRDSFYSAQKDRQNINNNCIFAGLLCTCNNTSKQNSYICKRHMENIFGLANIEIELKTEKETFKSMQTRFTRISKPFIPFPYSIQRHAQTGTLLISDKELPCLDEAVHREKWRAFADNAFQVCPPNVKLSRDCPANLSEALMDLSLYFPIITSTTCSAQVIKFRHIIEGATDFMNLMEVRWRHSKIAVLYTNRITNQQEIEYFPMSKLPNLYKVLLFHTEMSNNERENIDPKLIIYPPNMLLEADNFEFSIVNNSDESPIYLVGDTVTEGSSLVLAGKTKWRNSFNLWRRYPADADVYSNRKPSSLFPLLCKNVI